MKRAMIAGASLFAALAGGAGLAWLTSEPVPTVQPVAMTETESSGPSDDVSCGRGFPIANPPFTTCFSKEHPPSKEMMDAIEVAMRKYLVDHPEYSASGRWGNTAAGSAGATGDPVALTYSYVPDGVSIPGSNGEPTSNNILTSSMNSKFGGNTALWKSKIAACFTRWGQVAGFTFTEVSDDGASFPGSAGQNSPTVRGDIRIAGHPIDGVNGVLAYTFFPDTGDMVIDTAESWGSSSNDYRFLRNTVMHELGHAWGLGHVWPTNGTKLMEPFLNTSFDGPQDDDIRGGEWLYGDFRENDDAFAFARDLGTLGLGTTSLTLRSTSSTGDTDWMKFTVTSSMTFDMAVTPVGSSYPVGSSESSTPTINTLAFNNLNVELRNSTGGTILANGNTHAAGITETITSYALTAGTYVIRVLNASGANSGVQRYDASIILSATCVAPSISAHPSNQTKCAGQSATFSVTASGTATLNYQWRKNSNNISGATSSSYTISSVSTGDVGSYDCVVTNGCGNATSNAASLTVNTGPSISQQPSPATRCVGTSVTFSVTATGTGSLVYQWRKGGVPIIGAGLSSYTISSVGTGDQGTYDCLIADTCSSLASSGALLTINSAPSISQNPSNAAVCAGQPASFTVAATGTTPLSYQWRKGGTNITGATAPSYSITATVPGDAGSYDCVVTNACGNATCNPASLVVNTGPSISGHPAAASQCEGTPVSFTVTASGTGTLTYQWRKDTNNISGANGPTYNIASIAPGDVGSYDCVVTDACSSATSNAAALAVSTAPQITDSPDDLVRCEGQGALFSVAATGSGSLAYQWRHNSNNILGATGPSYSIPAVSTADAGPYDCVVTNACGNATSQPATLAVNTAPSITTQPSDLTVAEGSPAVFTIAVAGAPAPTLQWRKDTIDIAGETSTTLTIAAATGADSGSYDCVVTNACGSITSTAAALNVTPPCDPDYNQDGNADQDDVVYLINVVGGGDNPSGVDPDFNHDGNVDQDDVVALINTVGGGPCP